MKSKYLWISPSTDIILFTSTIVLIIRKLKHVILIWTETVLEVKNYTGFIFLINSYFNILDGILAVICEVIPSTVLF